MPKLTRVETSYTYHSVEVTEAQVLEAKKSNIHFVKLLNSVQNNMKPSRPLDGKTEYIIED
jgi:hypothetical protein